MCPAGRHRRSQRRSGDRPCGPCAADAALERAGRVVAGVLEGSSVSALTELIARVACTSIKLDALSDHLNDHPDAFVSGDSQCPRVVVQLLVVLADAGVEGIALARCVSCARPRRHLQVVTETGRLCDQCRKRDRAEPCARCTRTAPVARRLTTGEPLCHRCATADPTWWQPCSLCGTRGNVVSRVAGEPIGPLLLCASGHPLHRVRVGQGRQTLEVPPAAVRGVRRAAPGALRALWLRRRDPSGRPRTSVRGLRHDQRRDVRGMRAPHPGQGPRWPGALPGLLPPPRSGLRTLRSGQDHRTSGDR